MTENEKLITAFYDSFRKGDYFTMQKMYSDQAVFSDPVFRNLSAPEVRAMWEMLIKRGKDLYITFGKAQSAGDEVTVEWQATYTFSQTRRKVTNRIHAIFRFENAKIVSHTDRFSFHGWAGQAFGITGLLIGWTGFFKGKVRRSARRSLEVFMERGRAK